MAQPVASTPAAQPAQKSRKGLVWIIVIIVVLLLLGGGYLFKNKSVDSPDSTSMVASTEGAQQESPATAQDEATPPEQADADMTTDATPDQGTATTPEATQPASAESAAGGASQAKASEASKATAQPDSRAEAPAASQAAKQEATPTRESASASAAVDSNKSIDELALEVIKGNYGNGAERKSKLGARYEEIQKRVNEMWRSMPH